MENKQTDTNKVSTFWELVENELKGQNMSITEFARQLGVIRPTVYSWLKGKTIPNLDMYYKIVKVLNIKEENLKQILK